MESNSLTPHRQFSWLIGEGRDSGGPLTSAAAAQAPSFPAMGTCRSADGSVPARWRAVPDESRLKHGCGSSAPNRRHLWSDTGWELLLALGKAEQGGNVVCYLRKLGPRRRAAETWFERVWSVRAWKIGQHIAADAVASCFVRTSQCDCLRL
jgi:hypothetical protein